MAGTNKFWLFIPLTVLFCFAASPTKAQISQGGLPKTFSYSIPPDSRGVLAVQPPAPDMLREESGKQAEPYRFAVNLPVDIGISNDGTWSTAPDGSEVWRLTIRAAGALALTLYFDDFKLPPGGSFFVYNPSRTRLLGAFTAENNDPSGAFATELLPGDQITMEYDRLPGDVQMPRLHVSELCYAYRAVPDPEKMTDDFGNAGKCEVNINCEEGNEWQVQKKGIARVAVKLGGASYWCSGSLVNNVRNDHKPYFLTAYHCGQGTSSADRNKWIFYFHYETTGCPNPAKEPFFKSMTGSHLVATSGMGDYLGSDFYLLLLNKEIPANYDLYFNGWSRQESPPVPGKGIHHPEGDIKKISTYTAPLQPYTWSGSPALAHWKVTWIATANGHGVTEGGSSGSPIFDSGGHILGTLTGGDSSCDSVNSPDYYGRFSYHWDKNGADSSKVLKYWLDPDNTNTMILNGTTLSVGDDPPVQTIRVAPNPFTDQVTIELPGITGKVMLVVSDLTGHELLHLDLPANGNSPLLLNLGNLPPGIYFLRLAGERFSGGVKLIRQR